jgi:hypothetical protein
VWFGGLTLIREDHDQAELHGLLAKVRGIGTILISVKATDRPSSMAGQRDRRLSRMRVVNSLTHTWHA